MSNVNVAVSRPAEGARRATGAGPETETFAIYASHFLQFKSVSNEIVLREKLKIRHRSKIKMRSYIFAIALTLLLLSCSNVLLINQRLSISAGTSNLFGPRDFALLLILALALPIYKRLLIIAKRSFSWCICIAVVCLTFVYSAITAIQGAFVPGLDGRQVAAELAALASWGLPGVVAAHVTSWNELRKWLWIMTGLGILVAAGSVVEVFTGQPIVTGSASIATLTAESSYRRSTPSCWPLIMIAGSSLMAFMAGGQFGHLGSRLLLWGGLIFILFAAFLTQSRTLVLGLIASAIGLVLVAGRSTSRVFGVLVFGGVPLVGAISSGLVSKLMGYDVGSWFADRMSMVWIPGRLVEYAPRDERLFEFQDAWETREHWLMFGAGLGHSYAVDTSTNKTLASFLHNVFLHFATRFGIAGILLFGLFALATLRTALRVALAKGPAEQLRLAVALSVFNLFVCSQFGNVFAMTYMAPVGMTLCGLLISAQGLLRNCKQTAA